MITIIGLIIFGFCCWAIFSRHFCDGIIAKHLLVFSAITAMLTILDPYNHLVAIWSAVFLGSGLTYWAIRNYRLIKRRLRNF